MSNDLAERPILIIDDDPKLLAFVGRRLRQEQFMVETALNGRDGLDSASARPPSLVLLDLSMPVMNGIETLTSLRQWYDGPIIILSATEEEHQKVEALDLGADDYLTKPFGLEELVARVRSALRRVHRVAQSQVNNDPIINAGHLSIDLGHRTVTRDDAEVSLTRTEYELLRCLASNTDKVMTHRELLREVWGPEYGEETEYLRTFIKQLRRKLEPDPSRPIHLLTQPGRGYRFAL
ncbi:MAG: response regulator transcription factor [SAR202 cluster bacterium]|jgi:two-component system KDP operon response regulator KdpE|nr:response regulator transcription factor [SAR202 cluster bacterium]MDP6513780.1 response regulator transcription factor [SAR202 cluster bacterium]MDP6716032.1 response regulator transcription factor [SAR202 cluster bacterium]